MLTAQWQKTITSHLALLSPARPLWEYLPTCIRPFMKLNRLKIWKIERSDWTKSSLEHWMLVTWSSGNSHYSTPALEEWSAHHHRKDGLNEIRSDTLNIEASCYNLTFKTNVQTPMSCDCTFKVDRHVCVIATFFEFLI